MPNLKIYMGSYIWKKLVNLAFKKKKKNSTRKNMDNSISVDYIVIIE